LAAAFYATISPWTCRRVFTTCHLVSPLLRFASAAPAAALGLVKRAAIEDAEPPVNCPGPRDNHSVFSARSIRAHALLEASHACAPCWGMFEEAHPQSSDRISLHLQSLREA
jgi:hypothetical protein